MNTSPEINAYYSDEFVTLYHGDCRDILPQLTADVLITDPPYGVDFNGKATKSKAPGSGGYTTPDSAIGPEVVAMALPMVKRGAVFSGNRLLQAYPRAQDIGCVYCSAGAGMGPWGFVCVHTILYYGKPPKRVGSRPASLQSFETSHVDGHPCPKPVGWLEWLITHAADVEDIILDPFVGSGTTLVAAKHLGRKAIGIEIEERYCELAVSRLGQGVMFEGVV